MSEVFLGQIMMMGFDFAPRGFATCNGQLLSIAQNQALFALLGTQYGGNGVQTFALPNLQGRTPIAAGNLSGGSNFVQGQTGGSETVTLTTANLPGHVHQVNASSAAGSHRSPNGQLMATSSNTGAASALYAANGNLTSLAAASVSTAGSSQPHSNMQPYTVLNFCIALQGIFPSRN